MQFQVALKGVGASLIACDLLVGDDNDHGLLAAIEL